MAEDPERSFIRWQSITNRQLGYAINLILTLSVATLGFQVNTLLDPRFNPISWQRAAISISLLSFLFSTALGIYCVINRLRDFRITQNVARKREQEISVSELASDRGRAERLGKRTWKLFRWQIRTFGAGVLLVVIAIAGSVSEKLLWF